MGSRSISRKLPLKGVSIPLATRRGSNKELPLKEVSILKKTSYMMWDKGKFLVKSSEVHSNNKLGKKG